jgi:hypothetical protein
MVRTAQWIFLLINTFFAFYLVNIHLGTALVNLGAAVFIALAIYLDIGATKE